MDALALGRKAMRAALAALLLALVLLPVAFLPDRALAADRISGELSIVTDQGFTRLIFRMDEEVGAKLRVSGAVLVINFKKPVNVAVDRMNASAPDVISAARLDPDGSAIRIALAHPVKVNSLPAAERLYVDLLPDNWQGVMPGLPQEMVDELSRRTREAERQLRAQRLSSLNRQPPLIRVKVASQPTFIRYVFALPDALGVLPERADGKVTLNFDQQVRWDLADVKATLPSSLQSVDSEIDFASTAVIFTLNGTPEVRTFREDGSIVLDVGVNAVNTAASAATQPDAAQPQPSKDNPVVAAATAEKAPAIAPPETIPVKDADAAKPASPPPLIDAAAPPPAVTKLAAAKAEAKPQTKLETKPATPPPAPVAAVAPVPPKPAPASEAPPPNAAVAANAPATTPAASAKAAAEPVISPKPATESKPAADPKPAAEHKSAAEPKLAAEPKASAEPKPKPDGTIAAVVTRSGDSLRVDLPFAAPTPAAVFRRANVLWLVFDSAATIDVKRLTADTADLIRSAEFVRGQDGEAIVRIRLERPLLASLDSDGPEWIVNIGESTTVPTRPLAVTRVENASGGASIVVPLAGASKVHAVGDRAFGDRIMVVTALGPARGFLKAQDFVELRTLPSTHGVVVQPIADDITADLSADKVTFSRPGGLTLSAAVLGGEQQVAPNYRPLTFDTQLWGFDRQAKFSERQSELIRLAAAAPKTQRKQARFNLARFYLAQEMPAEAKAVLDVALADDNAADDVTGTVLKAISDVLLERPDDALKELANPALAGQQDTPLWRAIALAHQGRWDEARAAFKSVDNGFGTLPIELQRMAIAQSLRTAIEVRDFNGASRMVNELETIGVPPDLEPSVAVLTGRLNEGLGRREDALANYRAAAASSDRRSAAQGRLREIVLLSGSGDMPRADVIRELETVTTVWRGDETEVEGLKLLAHLYTEDARYRDAFHTMRTAIRAHPNSDLTRKIQDEAAITFDSLFLAGKGDALPPVEALGLFYDFRELTPIGRRGDEMIRRLADRLVGVDLLDQAAELLQHQVQNRLKGAARAQVAARLATIYLMNHKPDRALSSLQSTRSGDLPNDLRDQRLLLESRATSDTGRHELALELIANIKGRESQRLRADILWAMRRWREAGEAIELLYGERWRDFTPFTDTERGDVLRAAIAYQLAEETLSLNRLREKYAAKMVDGPDARAFDVVSAPAGSAVPEFKDVAKRVSTINTLDAFLKDMRARYPDQAATQANNTATPPRAPAGTPLKPDATPTGSIAPRLPRPAAR